MESNGQDGYYLNEICKRNKLDVIGISRSPVIGNVVDVSDYYFVENFIKSEKPEYIFHLAANSTTRHDALFENHETISTGTLNILESVKRHSPGSRVFITGSGLQFENNAIPISETDNFVREEPLFRFTYSVVYTQHDIFVRLDYGYM